MRAVPTAEPCCRRTLGGVAEEYLSAAQLARELGVTRQAVAVWRRRYAGTATPFPEPDVMTGSSPGWRAGRLTEIRAWRDTLPGQGAGGGRPRLNREAPGRDD